MTENEWQEVWARILKVSADNLDLMERKGRDYDWSGMKPPVLAPGVTPRQAIGVRMSDKLRRLESLGMGAIEARVDDEVIEETVRDFVNYGIMWLAADNDEESR